MTEALARLTVPSDVDFSDLKLTRDSDGAVSFDWAPIERLCAVNEIDIALFRDAPEGNVASLIAAWYAEHLQHGGSRDPVQDDLIAEVIAEDAFGGGISHQPGSA